MLQVWEQILSSVHRITGITNSAVIFTGVFALGVMLPVALLSLVARIASRSNLESTFQNFARFGYALIPLDVAGHVAHNLFHLLAEGKSVYYSVGSLFGSQATGSAALVSNGTIRILQFLILALGFWGSVYTVRRITYRRYSSATLRKSTLVPYTALVGILMALNVAMFLFPMAHRM